MESPNKAARNACQARQDSLDTNQRAKRAGCAMASGGVGPADGWGVIAGWRPVTVRLLGWPGRLRDLGRPQVPASVWRSGASAVWSSPSRMAWEAARRSEARRWARTVLRWMAGRS